MRYSRSEKQIYEEYLALCERIASSTGDIPQESSIQQETRKADLQKDFVQFCKYYFGHYMDSEFGWFHKKAAKEIIDDPNCFAILEWAREHAKSVFADVFIPLFLYARGELTGMLLISANENKAKGLLKDIQAEMDANQRWIHDFGEVGKMGDWRDGSFTTTDGIGFWAYGRGQSPRGARKAANRPNYLAIDDIDDAILVRNEKRVKDIVNYLLEDCFGAVSIKGARVVVAGNRIHKRSVLSYLVGDIEPDEPKRKGIIHIKVYAIENKRHGKADLKDKNARPAWKERYTIKEFQRKMDKMGVRASRREYFHEHMEEGHVFNEKWIHWKKVLPYKKYDELLVYCDPSFTNSKESDFKAILLLGRAKTNIDIIYAWVRQATISAMVNVFYDLYEKYESHATYYIEANMLQQLLIDDFTKEGELRGYQMPIRKDKRKKPNKFIRVENLSPLFERGLIALNQKEKQSPDMQELKTQLLGFPYGHDDAPDALEGGIFLMQNHARSSKFRPRTGKFNTNSNRY